MADNRNLKTGFITHKGARLYYESIGAGPLAVLLHAGITDMRLWDHAITPLQDAGFTVLRYDLRGCGQSRTEAVPFSHADDLAAVLAAREAEQAVLIGCSLGAHTALDFATQQPERVRALVLGGPLLGGYEADAPWPAELAEAEQALQAGDYEAASAIEVGVWVVGPGRERTALADALLAETQAVNADLLRTEMSGVLDGETPLEPPAAARLEALTMPVLILEGEHEQPLIKAHAAALAAACPHAEHIRVEGVGHLLPREQPETFNALVRGFVGRV
jgi:pimeloyl-ACP methyl ester carboxylesterase